MERRCISPPPALSGSAETTCSSSWRPQQTDGRMARLRQQKQLSAIHTFAKICLFFLSACWNTTLRVGNWRWWWRTSDFQMGSSCCPMRSRCWWPRPPWPASAGTSILWLQHSQLCTFVPFCGYRWLPNNPWCVCVHLFWVYFLVVEDGKHKSRFKPITIRLETTQRQWKCEPSDLWCVCVCLLVVGCSTWLRPLSGICRGVSPR